MSNYIEYGDKVAFHPGYYIKEIVDESGLTQEEFAMRLNTTPKTLSKIINGQQSLSPAIALKLSRMLGTSAEYWLNLQNKYDVVAAECEAEKDACTERKVFDCLNYKYFIENFQLPELKRDVQGQIKALREFLNVSTLTVLKNKDLTVSFRSEDQLSESNIIKANIMVQMAVNIALKTGSPKYDKIKFSDAIEYALTLTRDHERFYSSIRNEFNRCGVILVVLPNLPGSKTNGATRKIGNRVLLMINDRRTYADTFWFTLFHEIGHIMYDEFGISLVNIPR